MKLLHVGDVSRWTAPRFVHMLEPFARIKCHIPLFHYGRFQKRHVINILSTLSYYVALLLINNLKVIILRNGSCQGYATTKFSAVTFPGLHSDRLTI